MILLYIFSGANLISEWTFIYDSSDIFQLLNSLKNYQLISIKFKYMISSARAFKTCQKIRVKVEMHFLLLESSVFFLYKSC